MPLAPEFRHAVTMSVLLLGLVSAGFAELPAQSTICVDAATGFVLSQENADTPRPPASMIKMIMMLLVSEGLDAQIWSLDTPVTVTKHAEEMGGTQVYLKTGEVWPLGRLMDAIAVASANDAAMAVAEGLWGDEAKYLEAANKRARELGMSSTSIHSVHGLPPSPGDLIDATTARDMARLGMECAKHPRILAWVNQRELVFRPGESPKQSTNLLLTRMVDCDGMKTGYIRAAGFCITATAERGGIRLISVVMGSPSKYGRFNLARDLLEAGFSSLRRLQLLQRGKADLDPVPVENCLLAEVHLNVLEDVWVTVRAEDLAKVRITAEHPRVLRPPLPEGAVVGEVRVYLAEALLGRSPLAVPVDLEARDGPLTLRRTEAAKRAATAVSRAGSKNPKRF